MNINILNETFVFTEGKNTTIADYSLWGFITKIIINKNGKTAIYRSPRSHTHGKIISSTKMKQMAGDLFMQFFSSREEPPHPDGIIPPQGQGDVYIWGTELHMNPLCVAFNGNNYHFYSQRASQNLIQIVQIADDDDTVYHTETPVSLDYRPHTRFIPTKSDDLENLKDWVFWNAGRQLAIERIKSSEVK